MIGLSSEKHFQVSSVRNVGWICRAAEDPYLWKKLGSLFRLTEPVKHASFRADYRITQKTRDSLACLYNIFIIRIFREVSVAPVDYQGHDILSLLHS